MNIILGHQRLKKSKHAIIILHTQIIFLVLRVLFMSSIWFWNVYILIYILFKRSQTSVFLGENSNNFFSKKKRPLQINFYIMKMTNALNNILPVLNTTKWKTRRTKLACFLDVKDENIFFWPFGRTYCGINRTLWTQVI